MIYPYDELSFKALAVFLFYIRILYIGYFLHDKKDLIFRKLIQNR